MEKQRAYGVGRGIMLLGMLALASGMVRAADDQNVFTRLKELQLENSPPPMVLSESHASDLGSAASPRGVKGPIRTDPTDEVSVGREPHPWSGLGGIGGADTN